MRIPTDLVINMFAILLTMEDIFGKSDFKAINVVSIKNMISFTVKK